MQKKRSNHCCNCYTKPLWLFDCDCDASWLPLSLLPCLLIRETLDADNTETIISKTCSISVQRIQGWSMRSWHYAQQDLAIIPTRFGQTFTLHIDATGIT